MFILFFRVINILMVRMQTYMKSYVLDDGEDKVDEFVQYRGLSGRLHSRRSKPPFVLGRRRPIDRNNDDSNCLSPVSCKPFFQQK